MGAEGNIPGMLCMGCMPRPGGKACIGDPPGLIIAYGTPCKQYRLRTISCACPWSNHASGTVCIPLRLYPSVWCKSPLYNYRPCPGVLRKLLAMITTSAHVTDMVWMSCTSSAYTALSCKMLNCCRTLLNSALAYPGKGTVYLEMPTCIGIGTKGPPAPMAWCIKDESCMGPAGVSPGGPTGLWGAGPWEKGPGIGRFAMPAASSGNCKQCTHRVSRHSGSVHAFR